LFVGIENIIMYKPLQFIAEIAQAHDGSLGTAHSYIDMLANCGVDAVKFQTHIADAESSSLEQFRVNFSFEDATRFDYWKRMEFTPDQWAGLKKHCEDKGLEFMSSPFSLAAVDLLEKLNVKRYKIGSGEITNYLMLDKIAQTGKPIILSSGMSDWDELDHTVNRLKSFGNELAILQCTTAYPTLPAQWALPIISQMKQRYQIPVGFSDHSADIFAPLAAVALGAEIIEFHAVFHKGLFGPDAKASLIPTQIENLVKGAHQVHQSLQVSHEKSSSPSFDSLKIMFGKSLAVNKDLKSGHTISMDDLESKKPGDAGITAKNYAQVIGRKINIDIPKWDFLKEEYLD
jgi:N,N'-diacetyllegionaminate synthase